MTRLPFARHELGAALEPLEGGPLRVLRILHLAIPAGVALFLGVVGFLAVRPPQGSSYPGLPLLLTLPSLALGLGSAAAATVLPRRLLARRLESARAPGEAVQGLQHAAVVRLALLEAGALFGTVILLLAALDGSLLSRPLLWVNALPAAALFAVAALRWPERERLLDELEAAERAAR